MLDHERRDTVSLMPIGLIDAYLEEIDWWVTLPVRLADHCLSGPCIEVGVYTLDGDDIEVMRTAILAYDQVMTMRSAGITHELPE